MDDIAIVHITTVATNTPKVFDIVVKPICRGQREHLADLASQANSHVTKGIYEVFGELDYSSVREFTAKDALYQPVRNTIKEFGEVKREDVPLLTVFPVVFMQMLGQSVRCEGIALVFQTRAIIVDEGSGQYGDKSIVTKAALNYALVYGYAADMTLLTALHNVKLIKALAFEFAGMEQLEGL